MTTPIHFAPHALLALALVALAATPARAQVERPMRPDRGLLAGNAADSKAPKTLEATVSLFSAYDDDMSAVPESGIPGDATPTGGGVSGIYSGLNTGLTFGRKGEHINLGVTGSANYRYDNTAGRFETVSDQVGVTMRTAGRHDNVQISASTSYRPFFTFAPFAPPAPDESGELLPPSTDTTVSKQSAVAVSAAFSYEHRLGTRTTVSANVGWGRSSYSGEDFRQTNTSFGGLIRHNITSGVSLRVGYTGYIFSSRDDVGPHTTKLHNLDVGIDYSKRLGLTRRTTMGFSTGSSAVDEGAGTLFQGTGSAWLRRDLGKTWAAQAGFTRGIGVREGFDKPDLSNAVSMTFGGLIGHRLDFRSSAAYTKGAIGFSASNGYGAYNTSARLRFALTRQIAAYVEHVGYWYKFDQAADLPGAFASRVLRQGVRMGVTVLAPLIR